MGPSVLFCLKMSDKLDCYHRHSIVAVATPKWNTTGKVVSRPNHLLTVPRIRVTIVVEMMKACLDGEIIRVPI